MSDQAYLDEISAVSAEVQKAIDLVKGRNNSKGVVEVFRGIKLRIRSTSELADVMELYETKREVETVREQTKIFPGSAGLKTQRIAQDILNDNRSKRHEPQANALTVAELDREVKLTRSYIHEDYCRLTNADSDPETYIYNGISITISKDSNVDDLAAIYRLRRQLTDLRIKQVEHGDATATNGKKAQDILNGRKGKSLSTSTNNPAHSVISDLVTFGDSDTFKLICKASSESEGWMKSTKAMEIPGRGCVLQVTTQQGDNIAEALTFIPGVILSDIGGDKTAGWRIITNGGHV